MKTWKMNLAVVLVMVVAGLVVETASAQGRRGGGMFGGGGGNVSEVSLLSMNEVLEHLQNDYELSDEAMEAVQEEARAAQDELQAERRAFMGDMRNMDQDEREAAMEEMQEITKEINSDSFRTIKKSLSKKQLTRLNELKMQRMGIAALHDAVVQEMLEFDDEQVEKMKNVKKQAEDKQSEMMQDLRAQMQSGGGFDRDAIRDAMTDLQESRKKNAMECLTDKQKKTYEKMQGEKFEFPEPQQRRRGRNSNL